MAYVFSSSSASARICANTHRRQIAEIVPCHIFMSERRVNVFAVVSLESMVLVCRFMWRLVRGKIVSRRALHPFVCARVLVRMYVPSPKQASSTEPLLESSACGVPPGIMVRLDELESQDDEEEARQIERLLKEATTSYLRTGRGDDVHLDSPWHAARTKAILAARHKAWASRTRRPAKKTTPRSASYTMDIQECLEKYEIEIPTNLADAALALRHCNYRDASRALRVVFMNLLFGRAGHGHDRVRAQLLLEESLSHYGLLGMKPVFLLALQKHLVEDPCGPLSSAFRRDAN